MVFFEHFVKWTNAIPSVKIARFSLLVQAIKNENIVHSCSFDQSLHVGYRISVL
jgi:hypothetical protein